MKELIIFWIGCFVCYLIGYAVGRRRGRWLGWGDRHLTYTPRFSDTGAPEVDGK